MAFTNPEDFARCSVCIGEGAITCKMKTDHGEVGWSMPCPGCTKVLAHLHTICELKKRTKTTVIPDACESFVDEDDDSLTELSDREVTDDITDTTIEEFLE
jgi:hypothetical protein